jgi:putative hemolysin
MIMLLTGRLPKVTDAVNWEGWHFEIVDMDGKTIDKVLASRAPDDDEPGDGNTRPGKL